MKPLYTSELSHFLTQLKQKNPHQEQAQSEGRKLLWDKNNSIQQEKENQELQKNKVAHRGYTYFS